MKLFGFYIHRENWELAAKLAQEVAEEEFQRAESLKEVMVDGVYNTDEVCHE